MRVGWENWPDGWPEKCVSTGVRYGEGEHENPIVKWESKKGMNQQK